MKRRADHSLGRVIVFGLALSGTVAPFACIKLDSVDQVHDLRLLALRAEPPEVVLPDGGLATFAPSSMTLTALVADPLGGGRNIHNLFITCSILDTDARRCLEASPYYQVLKQDDDFATDGGWGEVSMSFTPSLGLLRDALAQDTFHGFGGLWLPVQLELSAGDESTVGYKRFVFTFPFTSPPSPANTNPRLTKVRLNDQDWEPGAIASLRAGDNEIVPIPDPNKIQEYDRPAFDGTLIHFRESWRYSFFATSGSFRRSTSGGTNNFTGEPVTVDNTWKPDGTPRGQEVVFWIVVRDGRGGENWEVRRGHVP